MREHGTLHIPDVRAQKRFPDVGFRRRLAHLLGRSPSSAGGIHWTLIARRTEVRPFTPAQIKLLETFADQAVIAIENVRLFQELQDTDARAGAIGRGTESVGRGRPGGQLYSRSPDRAQHHRRAGRFSSPEPIAASSTSTMSRRKSFIFGPATKWKRSWSTPIRQPRSVSDKGLPVEQRKPECRTRLPTFARSRSSLPEGCGPSFAPWLSIASRGAAPSRAEDHGSLDDLPARNRQLCAGSRESSSDLCHAVSPGDPERAAVPRDRG